MSHQVLSTAAITALLETLSVSPVHGSSVSRPSTSRASLFLMHPHFSLVQNRAGISRSQLQNSSNENRFPHFRVEVTAELREVMRNAGMVYSVDGNDLDRDYFLELLESGTILARYQSILGSRIVGELAPDQVVQLIESMASRLREREGMKANDEKPTVHRAAATPAPAGSRIPAAVLEQASMLVPRGARLELPAQQLTEYAAIKSLVEKAGGKYQRGGFNFRSEEHLATFVAGLQTGQPVNEKKQTQFFATQPPEVEAMLEELQLEPYETFLEPSAGDGAIAAPARALGAQVTVIENWPENVKALEAKDFSVIAKDFLHVTPEETGLFDVIGMNPPFSQRQDVAHIKHALSFLEPTGRLSAIMSPAFQTSGISAHKQFKELLEFIDAPITPIDAGAFKAAGTMVSTVRVHIDMATLNEKLVMANKSPSDFGLNLAPLAADPVDDIERSVRPRQKAA
jgi:predicted RNA methylase